MAVCASCARACPPEFRFCPECGAPLPGPDVTGESGERKVVTVLFCDLVGFTSVSEHADPEDVRSRLMPYYRLLRECVEAFGGTVEKFVGDAVLALFGVPSRHEDDAERAIRAGLRALAVLAGQAPRLHVRIGVNTGEVLAVSAPGRPGEGSVAGDVVNTAARIQAGAPVDSLVVGEGTYRAAAQAFDFEALPALQAKGKAAPVAVYRVLAPKSRTGIEGLRVSAGPLVGRVAESEALRAAFEQVAQAGAPHLLTLLGEPGIGKSRLIAELARHLDRAPDLVVWRQGRCLPYGDGFWALAEIVKGHAGVLEADPPDVVVEKLAATLPAGARGVWLRERLLPLLGIGTDGAAGLEESFSAWSVYLAGFARRGPAVVVFDDLHWATEALLDFVAELPGRVGDAPLLVLCSARPELLERRASWADGEHAARLRLGPLSDTETAALVAMHLDDARLDPLTYRSVVERAAGNPLYAEEFARMVRERGSGGELAFPAGVQALIGARLDALAGPAKAVLAAAAVVGRVFWPGAVARLVGPGAEDLAGTLTLLARREFVRPLSEPGLAGEDGYAFSHGLVCDVAYAALPRAVRAARHLGVVGWLEDRPGIRLADAAEVLAHHSWRALELAEAAHEADLAEAARPAARRYALLAADKAANLDAEAALPLYERALGLTPAGEEGWADVRLRWAEAARHVDRLHEASGGYGEAAERYLRTGRGVPAARALAARASVRFYLGEQGHAADRERAAELLADEPPSPELTGALAELSAAAMLASAYRPAVGFADRALAHAERSTASGRALSSRGWALIGLGEVDRGTRDLEQAIDVLRAAGAGHGVAVCFNNLGLARWLTQGPPAALAVWEEGIAFARARGLSSAVRHMTASSLLPLIETGRLADALARADALYEEVRDTGHLLGLEALAARARVLVERGDPAAAELAERLLAAPRPPDDLVYLVIVVLPAVMGRLLGKDLPAARAALDLLAGQPALPDCEELGPRLPALVRCALAADHQALARALVDAVEPRFALHQHALVSARAELAAADGRAQDAYRDFTGAAGSWARFGNRLEQAQAELGAARAARALARPEAARHLRAARQLFAGMGATAMLGRLD